MSKKNISDKKSTKLEALLSEPFNPLIRWGVSIVIVFLSFTMFLYLSRTTVTKYVIHPYKCYETQLNNLRTITVYTQQQLPQWVSKQKKVAVCSIDYSQPLKGDIVSILKYHNKFIIILRIEDGQNIIADSYYLVFSKEQSYLSIIFATLKASNIIPK